MDKALLTAHGFTKRIIEAISPDMPERDIDRAIEVLHRDHPGGEDWELLEGLKVVLSLPKYHTLAGLNAAWRSIEDLETVESRATKLAIRVGRKHFAQRADEIADFLFQLATTEPTKEAISEAADALDSHISDFASGIDGMDSFASKWSRKLAKFCIDD
ncbi:MAG: hypothetical protein WD294_10985 [Phycisphaeraceae bacterium]